MPMKRQVLGIHSLAQHAAALAADADAADADAVVGAGIALESQDAGRDDVRSRDARGGQGGAAAEELSAGKGCCVSHDSILSQSRRWCKSSLREYGVGSSVRRTSAALESLSIIIALVNAASYRVACSVCGRGFVASPSEKGAVYGQLCGTAVCDRRGLRDQQRAGVGRGRGGRVGGRHARLQLSQRRGGNSAGPQGPQPGPPEPGRLHRRLLRVGQAGRATRPRRSRGSARTR